jgi:hypothetical protein
MGEFRKRPHDGVSGVAPVMALQAGPCAPLGGVNHTGRSRLIFDSNSSRELAQRQQVRGNCRDRLFHPNVSVVLASPTGACASVVGNGFAGASLQEAAA